MQWWLTRIAYHATIRADPGRGPTAGPPVVVWATEELIPALTAVSATRTESGDWDTDDLIIVPDALATQVFAEQTQAVAAILDPQATARAQAQLYVGQSSDPALQATASTIRDRILTAYPDEGRIEPSLDGANSANQARMQETLVALGLAWTPTPFPFAAATQYVAGPHPRDAYIRGKVLIRPDAATLARLDDLYNRYLRAVTFTDGLPPEDLEAALADLVLPEDPQEDFSAACSRDALVATYDAMRERGYYVRVHLPEAPVTFMPPDSDTPWRDGVTVNSYDTLTLRREPQAETVFPADIVSAETNAVIQPLTLPASLHGSRFVEFVYDPDGQRWWLRNDPGSPLCTVYSNAVTYAIAFWFQAPELP